MIKLMQQIYRRWLGRYRWANLLRAAFLKVYLRYWTLESAAEIPYSIQESAAQLAEEDENKISAKVWRIKNATLVGYSRFILKDRKAAYDVSCPNRQLKDIFATYLFQEEPHLLVVFKPQEERCLFPHMTIHARLDGAWLSLMSASADNWMHWLSESIPRLAVALDTTKNLNFGLLLDQRLPKNMRDVLGIFAAKAHRFEVPTHHAVEVAYLLVPATHTGMSVFWPRLLSGEKGIFHFDEGGLMLARHKILEHFDCQPRKAGKIFVLRKSSFRHIANQAKVELLLRSYGFVTICPEEMSVEEQVKAFSQASVVVAQAGAALANVMFMPQESAVICLSVRSEHVNYEYFCDYAKIFGVSLKYVLGEIDDANKYDEEHIGKMTHPMNAEFVCPEEELVELLENRSLS